MSDTSSPNVHALAQAAGMAIPPVWPLASSVAVNPFLGQSDRSLCQVSALLARVAGTRATMPRAWFADKLAAGQISEADLEAASAGAFSLADLKAALARQPDLPAAPGTVAQLAADVSGIDWPGLLAERFGHWAAGYLDEGQALWAAPRRKGAYAAWRDVATHDLTLEIAGLKGFAAHVADAPDKAEEVLERATARLGLSAQAQPTYFHQLLMGLGGWAQYARYRLWSAQLASGDDTTLTDFLTIALLMEEALFGLYEGRIKDDWAGSLAAHEAPLVPGRDEQIDAVLQEAAERAGQRALAQKLAAPARPMRQTRPAMQMAFCIDVRSEVFRRALESVNPDIETKGFAGFFGLATGHKAFASDVEELRLPVLLNPGVHSHAGGPNLAKADQDRRLAKRAKRAWGRFKLAAVSSFAFVEAAGPIYAGRLVRDGLALHKKSAPDDPVPSLQPAQDLPSLVGAANTVLNAMAMTQNFARLIVVAGHGASVVNNPHESALHCGACGGYSGEVNARLLAGLLNDTQVREGLVAHGITIPADTLFMAGLHDTTTDGVTLYEKDVDASAHGPDLAALKGWLAKAASLSCAERALRLPGASGQADIGHRARNWAEVRPEWALAGCSAFIAAPRARTMAADLGGRAFLHDYDWKADTSLAVLELIMTAPVVVASWISLQYYGSTVAPGLFGAGNKLLHNVVGGIGVVEGNGGVLRAGLPWQSVHDGQKLAHDPLRLTVCIEAPRDAMSGILAKHDGVRALFDNRWLHLLALDEDGQIAWRYAGDLKWEGVEPATAAVKASAA